MQTPRFSGHACSAGDFVFTFTFSRPFRTNCANVGTALPQSSNDFAFPFRTCERSLADLPTERVTSDPGGPTKFPRHIPAQFLNQLVRLERFYSALRGWRPIPAALLAPLPNASPETGELPPYSRAQILNKSTSIGKKKSSVKTKMKIGKLSPELRRPAQKSARIAASHLP